MNPRLQAMFPLLPKIISVIIGLFLLFAMMGWVFVDVDAGQIVVIQDLFDGELHFYNSPGFKPRMFGYVTEYRKSFQFWFSSTSDQGMGYDQSIKVRFNDGGHAQISGSVRIDLPLDPAKMTEIHTTYRSQHAIEQELIRTVIEKSIYMTGPLMSSKESYADRRNELINFIEDQAMFGVYETTPIETKTIDPMTGAEKTVTMVQIARDSTGMPARQEEASPMQRFGVKMFNLSINSIDYDNVVANQIVTQQQAIMEVQTAMAEAKKAEQAAITAEKTGQALAAQAKWEQEVIKAKAVVQGEQQLEVARLERQASEEQKQREILLGQGEAERKRLTMSADGALRQKLDAWIEVNKAYADAIAKYPGNWVPQVVMGDANGKAGSGADQMIQLLMSKTARDLSLDLSVPKGATSDGK